MTASPGSRNSQSVPSRKRRDLTKMVEDLGFQVVEISRTRGDHIRLKVSNGEKEALFHLPLTASDHRADMNARANIRRAFAH